MNTWTVAYYTFLQHVRDVRSIIAFIMLPIAVVLVAGTALSGDFTPKTVDPAMVGYLNEDKGALGLAWDGFMNGEQTQSLLQVQDVVGMDAGRKAVIAGELDGLLYIPSDLTKQWQNGKEIQVDYYSDEPYSLVLPVLESFVRNINKDAVLMTIGVEDSDTKALPSSMLKDIGMVSEGKIPRALDYYGITLLFQCLLLGGMFGIFAITKDFDNHMYARFVAAPVSNFQIGLGKWIGSTATLYGIACIVVLIFKYGFSINWSGSLWLIMLVLLQFCAIAVGLGIFFANLTRSLMLSTLVVFFLGTLLTFAAGGFTRMEGKVMDFLSHLAPGTYGQEVLFQNIYEGTVSLASLSQMTLYTGIVVALVFLSGRRRAR
ncbi:ABC-2 type transport system permease protein [Paenibacillus sp. DS2015]|uniref:ABC transporter permease n=1 Tax=Paenibacillus sp. DS2015 TaxID=3373917 RepID=UPI003D22A7D7